MDRMKVRHRNYLGRFLYGLHENIRIVTVGRFSGIKTFHFSTALCKAIEAFEGVRLLYFFLAILGSGKWERHGECNYTEYQHHGWVLEVGRSDKTGKGSYAE